MLRGRFHLEGLGETTQNLEPKTYERRGLRWQNRELTKLWKHQITTILYWNSLRILLLQLNCFSIVTCGQLLSLSGTWMRHSPSGALHCRPSMVNKDRTLPSASQTYSLKLQFLSHDTFIYSNVSGSYPGNGIPVVHFRLPPHVPVT
jgi:hypothetical protein